MPEESRTLFPVIKADPSLFTGLRGVEPRPRREALKRALKERSLLLDLNDIVLSQADGDEYITLEDWVKHIENIQFEDWEEGTLGQNFPVQWAEHGLGVRALLEPAFKANKRLYVIDPYFGADEKDLIDALLGAAKDTRHLESIVTGRHKDGWDGVFTPALIEKKALRLASYLTTHSQTQRQFVWWYVNRDTHLMHDRYIGFQPQKRNGTSPTDLFHALTIGAGIESLTKHGKKAKHTYLARVSSQHFSRVWNYWKKLAVFCICADNFTVQKTWGRELRFQSLENKRAEARSSWNVRVFEQPFHA